MRGSGECFAPKGRRDYTSEGSTTLPLNFPYFEQKVLVLPLMQSKIFLC